MGKGIRLGVENKERVGCLAENSKIYLSAIPGYEASGAFFRLEIALLNAEVDAQRWGGRMKTIVFHNPSEYD